MTDECEIAKFFKLQYRDVLDIFAHLCVKNVAVCVCRKLEVLGGKIFVCYPSSQLLLLCLVLA